MTIKIGGVAMPPITDQKEADQDMVTNSNRVGSGKMRFNFVDVKKTLSLTWTMLTQTELQKISSAIERKSFFTIEYFDTTTNSRVSKTFYKGDRTKDNLKNLNDHVYGNFTCDFIEQ